MKAILFSFVYTSDEDKNQDKTLGTNTAPIPLEQRRVMLS